MGAVFIVGSANLDTAVEVQEHPLPGETVLGSPIDIGAGGKGLNQAIAAARAGATTSFVGAVGVDSAAADVRETLAEADVHLMLGESDRPTGIAFVMVTPAGENAIVVVPGANADSAILSDQLSGLTDEIGPSDVVLAQLEIPLDVVSEAFALARARGARTVLNAAPSRPLPAELLSKTDILIVNQHECADIAGPAHPNTTSAALALATGVGTVIVTLGEDGSLVAEGTQISRYGAHAVTVVDTTAAGDAFCGAIAAQLAAGEPLPRAIGFCTAGAALTVQRHGAAASIPHRGEILSFLATGPNDLGQIAREAPQSGGS